jgi:hypothetical protein
MSVPCPIYGKAIYMDCQDCIERICKMSKYKTICIGIDQSYANTGISITADGVIKKVTSINLSKYHSNSDKRRVLRNKLDKIVKMMMRKASKVVCIIERIRLRSKGFVNINYIKSIGALNVQIVDIMSYYNIATYSVDTRCWKAQVIGTSKPEKNNFGVPEEKWPTVKWVINMGFEDSILVCMEGTRKKEGTFYKNGTKYMYNNDAADSAGISMFWFKGDRNKLEEER